MTTSDKSSHTHTDSDEIDLGRLLSALFDYRWAIGGITLLFMVIGLGYSLVATPVYKANALLQVEKKSSALSLVGDMTDMLSGRQSDTSAELELLVSRMIIGKTVKDLNLDIQVTADYFPVIGKGIARLRGMPKPDIVIKNFTVSSEHIGKAIKIYVDDSENYQLEFDDQVFHGQVNKVLDADGINLLISNILASPGQSFTLVKRPRLDVVRSLQQALRVTEKGNNTGIISLEIEGDDRKRIKSILDSVSKNYLQQNVTRKTEEAESSLSFLKNHLPKVKMALNSSEELLNQYRQANESVDLSLEAKSALETLVQIEKQLNELTFKEAELQQLYTKQHPAYVALLDKRKTLAETKKELNQSIKRLPKTQQEILRLTRDVQVGQEIYVQLLNKQQELSILKAGTVGNVRIIDEAVVESSAVKPKKPLIIAAMTMLGLILSIGVVLLRVMFRKGIEGPEQLEEIGISVYATIPLSETQAKLEQQQKKRTHRQKLRLLAIHDPTDLAIEALRSLRTTLHFSMMESANKVILLSGSAPELGKSFISVNLAAVLALGNKRVLLIDADMRRGHLHKVLESPQSLGLSEYLAGQNQLKEIITRTYLTELDFVSRGDTPPNPSELLMHNRFKELLSWAEEHYDYVLIDTPPILAVTDAAIIGRYAGTSLLIARYYKTRVKEVDVAIRRFEQNGTHIKGVLLNAVEKNSSLYYGGHYQYSYKD
ncbi:polysaccharide biosynthesis tyrosine autokinase [Photorhabdus temperata]|uniref:Capsular exopolysaccharide biosynthesis protein n=2 Tax=Photorhabdus temperata TaxID=574560 RepID=A0A081S1Q9_PHOTE|nr:polysaccharide biosynthesis tyrosine autokinase [Photorhabdus temperata]ERT14261.1 tyrosine protein kinase [Photorhabdus temperata J3]KER04862.1 capsular exopolysaccharide biosynthesis protein [Photorhabdus temperata subsp. temperata Meg1]MCT8345935.1 polysaccharide biosynthesis tyrosine autokinase [Photorhabdus temperata]